MGVQVGQELTLAIDKAAAGGRMIGRHDGQVVLVAGAIPGERVHARIDRVEPRLAFATAVAIVDPSSDRREGAVDPHCGGMLYSHIRYDRQLTLKGEVVADAFARLGRLPLANQVSVAASPERGYRIRARFHVRGTRVGFFREGTHDVCDPAPSGQLSEQALDAVRESAASLMRDGGTPVSIELTENMAGTERAIHADVAVGARVSEPALARAAAAGRLAGCTARTAGGVLMSAGEPTVGDPFEALTEGRARAGELRRHPQSFFQANRYLLPSLVTHVLDSVPDDTVLDLYAGVGMFALSLAAVGRRRVTAVEGDQASGKDLEHNAAPFSDAVRVVITGVEEHLASSRERPSTIVVDPPRTGISKTAMDAIARQDARRIVYISCDPATMARDARRLVDAGYRIVSLRGFDLFPNTPHVETACVFDR